MTHFALCSLRSCGVTTTALGLTAALAATEPVVLAELDPHGGTLAARLGLAAEPGLVSLAAAARRRGGPEVVLDHTQALPHGGQVLLGPATGSQACAALAAAASVLEHLDAVDVGVVADCGRVGDLEALASTVGWADQVVVICRPELADLHALASSLHAGHPWTDRLGLVLCGNGPYPAGEVSDAIGLSVIGHVPFDPDGAILFAAPGPPAKALWRSPFGRAVRSLADQLAASHPAESRRIARETAPSGTERPAAAIGVPRAADDDPYARMADDRARVAR
ncbi:MAG: hypothetical protein ACYDD4_05255 [Acidimicrobiales bacterium]